MPPPGSHSLSYVHNSDFDICCYGAHSKPASPGLGFGAFYPVGYCDSVSHCFDSGVGVGNGVSDTSR